MSKVEEVEVNTHESEESEEYDMGEEEQDGGDEEDEEDGSDDDNDQENRMPIDLSTNEVYRGICTLLEDEEGNNILEYISLLHTELIGINKSLENLRGLRKDMSRIADCLEGYVSMSMKQSEKPLEKPLEKSSEKSSNKDKSSRTTSKK